MPGHSPPPPKHPTIARTARLCGCSTVSPTSGSTSAEDLRGGHSIESGHHMAEEASGEVAASLLAFLGSVEDDVR
jgi:hypothetical protein